MREFLLPDLGEGLQEAEIVSWHVNEGDHVVADQPLVSVETDKAVVEVPAPYSGTVAKLHGKEGEQVPVGAVLVEFEETQRADSGTVVGSVSDEEEEESASSGAAPEQQEHSTAVRATPAIRALARKLEVDLSLVQPSGPNNTVTKADVERAAKSLSEAGPLETLRGVRRAMAQKMAQSHKEVVPANLVDLADIEAWPRGTDVTVRLVRAIGQACKASPSLNAWYDSQSMGRRLHQRVDLGIAVNTDEGLFVPTLRDITNRDAADLRRGLDALRKVVEAREIPPEELRGQTITLSNFGMLAGLHAQMIVVPPQVAIVGAGRIEPRVIALEGKPAVHRILPLSLTFDHRAVTGGEAAAFLAAMMEDLKLSH